jgi:hypothetical protein
MLQAIGDFFHTTNTVNTVKKSDLAIEEIQALTPKDPCSSVLRRYRTCSADVDDALELRISDEGIGMDMATQKHVFEKFYSRPLSKVMPCFM